MADYNDFSISLGGEINAASVNLSIKNIESKINPINLKVRLNTSSLQSEISKIQTQLGSSLSSIGQSKTLNNSITSILKNNQKYTYFLLLNRKVYF